MIRGAFVGPLRGVLGGVLVAMLGLAAPLEGQADTGGKLPVEFFQGFQTRNSSGIRPYTGSLSIIPGYSFESFRLGFKVSADYENPGWTTRFGARMSRRVSHVFRDDIGFVLSAEGTSNLDGNTRWGLGLTFDVDGLIRVGTLGGYDSRTEGGFFGIVFGADPTSWFGCVRNDVTGECIGDRP